MHNDNNDNEKKGAQWLHKSRLGSLDRCEKGDGTRQGAGLCEPCPALDLKMLAHPGLLLAK